MISTMKKSGHLLLGDLDLDLDAWSADDLTTALLIVVLYSACRSLWNSYRRMFSLSSRNSFSLSLSYTKRRIRIHDQYQVHQNLVSYENLQFSVSPRALLPLY